MKNLLKWLILLPLLKKMVNGLAWMLRPFHPLVAFINKLWQGLSPFNKNVVFGFLITLLLIGLHNGQWVSELEDLSVDWMMTLYRGDLVKEDTRPFVILDIDEESYQAWGEPFFTPRDKLLKLLDFAVQGEAKLIIVDLAIDKQPPLAGSLHPHDLALKYYLADYDNRYCSNSDCPTIVLTRTFRLPKGIKPFDPNTPKYYLAQRATFLDKVVMRSSHIYWGSTQYEREHDRLVRRWDLWIPTCTQSMSDVIPSMPLLAAALLVEGEKPGILPCSCRLRHHLNYFLPNCDHSPEKWTTEALRYKPTEFVVSEDLVFDLQPTRLSRRILYTIPWHISPGKTLPSVSDGRPLLTIMSANKVLNESVSDKALRDSITIIGGSYLAGRDWHDTPLGWMPGVLILVNSLHSLLQYGVLYPPSTWWILLFATILIMVTSWLLIHYGSLWGGLYSAFLILALIPVSFVLFKYGIWLSFAIPWAAVQLRQMIDF
jgi:CHASE2 domain-containing sensor protein